MKKSLKMIVLGIVALVIVVVAIGAFLLLNPNRGNFNFSQVNIAAQLETDGTLRVVDQRTVTSASDVRNIHWKVDKTSQAATLRFEGVRIITKDAEIVQIASKRYDYNWTSGLSMNKQIDIGERGSYSFDDVNSILYIFLTDELQELEDAVIEVVYSVKQSVYVYDDVAELYWDYYVSDDAAKTPNLSVQLALPVGEDEVATPGVNVWGWGHGPAGTVDFDNGTYLFTSVQSSSHAGGRAHVIVDKSWLGNVDRQSEMIAHGARKDYAVSEEAKWSDTTLHSAVNTQIINLFVLAICALTLLISTLLYWRKMGDYKSVVNKNEHIGRAFDDKTKKLQRNYLIIAAAIFFLGILFALLYNAFVGLFSSIITAVMLVEFANYSPSVVTSWREALA